MGPISKQSMNSINTAFYRFRNDNVGSVHEVNKTESKCIEIDSTNRFELDLKKAEAAEYIPACLRLALYICKKLTKSGRYLEFFSGKNTTIPTRSEIALVYNEFIAVFDQKLKEKNDVSIAFNEKNKLHKVFFGIDAFPLITLDTLPIHWYDNSPELIKIIENGFAQIENTRKRCGNGANLPIICNWEDGLLLAMGGCARYSGWVVNHEGEILEENPWKTFYRTEDPTDEKRAQQLCPDIPEYLKMLFANRKIIRVKGYTFTQNALELCRTGNWELVHLLIKEEKGNIPHHTGFKVLKYATNAHHHKTCVKLFKAGLPIFKNKSGISPDSSFLKIIQTFEDYGLFSILKIVKHPGWHLNALDHLAYSLFIRSQVEDVNGSIIELTKELGRKLVISQHPDYKGFYNIPEDIRRKSTVDFYKMIIAHFDKSGKKFINQKFEEMMRSYIRNYELEIQIGIEISHFPGLSANQCSMM